MSITRRGLLSAAVGTSFSALSISSGLANFVFLKGHIWFVRYRKIVQNFPRKKPYKLMKRKGDLCALNGT